MCWCGRAGPARGWRVSATSHTTITPVRPRTPSPSLNPLPQRLTTRLLPFHDPLLLLCLLFRGVCCTWCPCCACCARMGPSTASALHDTTGARGPQCVDIPPTLGAGHNCHQGQRQHVDTSQEPAHGLQLPVFQGTCTCMQRLPSNRGSHALALQQQQCNGCGLGLHPRPSALPARAPITMACRLCLSTPAA